MKLSLEQVPALAANIVQSARIDEFLRHTDFQLKYEPHHPVALALKGHILELTGKQAQAAQIYRLGALVLPHHPMFRGAVQRAMQDSPQQCGEFLGIVDHEAKLNGGHPTMPSIEPVQWRGKIMYVPRFPLRDPIGICLRSNKIHDEPVYEALRAFINPGDAVLDIGANFGLMTTMLADAVGPSGKVYSFEANAFNHHILSLNMSKNGLSQVEPVFRAVTDCDNVEMSFPPPDFELYPSHGSFGISTEKGAGAPILSITIDSMNIERKIAAMKVDIQGADLLALRGARQTIERQRMPIIVEYEEALQAPFGTGFQDYVDFVAAIGYRFDKVIDSINFLLLPR